MFERPTCTIDIVHVLEELAEADLLHVNTSVDDAGDVDYVDAVEDYVDDAGDVNVDVHDVVVGLCCCCC